MKISKFDKILDFQTDDNYIPDEHKAYFGGVYRKEELRSQLSSYIDGYREATDAIYERFKKESGKGHIWVQDTIVFPLIFNHRHCVELEIKHLFCLSDSSFDKLKFNTTHKLGVLWSKIKDFIIERSGRIGLSYDTEAIGHYINQIESLDEGSFRFRYPMDVNLKSTNKELTILNVDSFHCQMNLFHDTMEEIFNALCNQVDDWTLTKDFKRQFKFCLSSNIDKIKSALDYDYPIYDLPDKHWLSSSDIPDPGEDDFEKEYQYCHGLSKDIKELLLILYYSIPSLKLNNIVPPNSQERLNDILKVCNDTYCNENVFGHNNLDAIFIDKFSCLVSMKRQIIFLANEIATLIKNESTKL